MRRKFHHLCIAACAGFATLAGLSLPARAEENVAVKTPAASADDQSARELGRKVLAVRQALANPKAPGAMQAITDLGLDSRHYVMVRGWLVQELAGATSIRDANRGKVTVELNERIDFLHKAIRAIDLEK